MPWRSDRKDRGTGPGDGGCRRLGLLVCLMVPMVVAAAGGEDYLDMIDSEAQKIETPAGSEDADEAAAEVVVSAADIETFEQEMKAQYRGSYLFYKKLSRPDQEEIFLEYQKGASIEDIRKKIMDRFLQSE